MRILYVNFSDIIGGGNIAAYRFHREMVNHSIDSNYFVRKKTINDSSVYTTGKLLTLRNKLNVRMETLLLKILGLEGSLPFGIIPDLNYKMINQFKADIVHLHWINGGFISLGKLRKINAPIVWTLHDMWLFGPAEHYFTGLENLRRLERLLLSLKKKFITNMNKVIFVTPSKWLKEEAEKSEALKHSRIEVIHNGIDIKKLYPINQMEAKHSLGLDKNKKTILFGAVNINDPKIIYRKGIDIIRKILQELYLENSTSIQVAVFGTNKAELNSDFYYPTYYLGNIKGEDKLRYIYSAADVFLLPSRFDNLPNTGIESLACGTPIVAFNVGGIPEIIEHKVNGYIAISFNNDDFANGIKYVLENRNVLSVKAREVAVSKFDIKKNTISYINLYKEIINDNSHKKFQRN